MSLVKQMQLYALSIFKPIVQVRHKSCMKIPENIKCFVDKATALCNPCDVHICDGSRAEYDMLVGKLMEGGGLQCLPLYNDSFYIRSDPGDVARTEGRTFLVTPLERDSVPKTKCGVKSTLGNWMCPKDADKKIGEVFCNAMEGRTMYVIPFVMGPYGSHFSRVGVELTDSAYVALSMKIMTRMGERAMKDIDSACRVVKGLHCCGKPACPNPEYPWWPSDPERCIVLHMMERDEIFSYGSGYGGNSLLGKKCFALRFASLYGKKEGWLAEHMLIIGVEPKCGGPKRYIAAAFPSACGKTNLAMLNPSIPGYKVSMVGDDIAWIRPNQSTQMLHAVNPESGMFGVAPGTSAATNPNAMAAIFKNSLFTNTATTSDGGVWWEGMEEPCPGVKITDWHGKPWDKSCAKTPAAHPNSRFTTPASQVPTIDCDWESIDGVPISAIVFGGRRPEGVPLVYQAYSWNHGVMIGSGVKSLATSAAEHKAGTLMHDPFAMRPFFGYNYGYYLKHWLNMAHLPCLHLPQIFHVNWFLKGKEGGFAWPGFGENVRVLDWIMKRLEGAPDTACPTPIGWIPTQGAINFQGLKPEPDFDTLFKIDKKFWMMEFDELKKFFDEQLPDDTPCEVIQEIMEAKKRLCDMKD